jgi:FixJ family two-component response regulator
MAVAVLRQSHCYIVDDERHFRQSLRCMMEQMMLLLVFLWLLLPLHHH